MSRPDSESLVGARPVAIISASWSVAPVIVRSNQSTARIVQFEQGGLAGRHSVEQAKIVGSFSAFGTPTFERDGPRPRKRKVSVPVPWTMNSVTITASPVSQRSHEEMLPNRPVSARPIHVEKTTRIRAMDNLRVIRMMAKPVQKYEL